MIVWYFAVVAEPLREAQDSRQLPTIQPPVTRPWKKGTNTHFFSNISASYVFDHTSLSFVCKYPWYVQCMDSICIESIPTRHGSRSIVSLFVFMILLGWEVFLNARQTQQMMKKHLDQQSRVQLDQIENCPMIVKHAGINGLPRVAKVDKGILWKALLVQITWFCWIESWKINNESAGFNHGGFCF